MAPKGSFLAESTSTSRVERKAYIQLRGVSV